MTDLLKLAKRLYDRTEWQETLETVSIEDLCGFIAEAIRELYVNIGRGDEDIES